MDKQSFFLWLFSDAGAGWVFGLVSLIGLIISYTRKNRFQRIIFKELRKRSLVDIKKSIRNKIKITFDEKPVSGLSQIHAAIFNDGVNVIKDITLRVYLPENVTFLDVLVEPVSDDFLITNEIENNSLIVKIPYLQQIPNQLMA
jgi:hypothetical protein